MIKKVYETLRFEEDKEVLRAYFLDLYYFEIPKKELLSIGKYEAHNHTLKIDANPKKETKLDFLLSKGFKHLTNKLTKKKTTYIHKNSEIPLIGSNEFGIVDRGSNIIEIKPISGCNLDCTYCSVDENKRIHDFVIEKDYLVSELRNLIEIKKHDVEIHIGCQGEPILYKPLPELIKDLRKIRKVKRVSIDTNMTLLTEKKADELISAGLTHLNVSINTLDEEKAKSIANKKAYHPKKIIELTTKLAKRKDVKIRIAPVLIKGVNEEDIDELIKYAKKIKASLGIQNYLEYSYGKKQKSIGMEEFYERLRSLEEKHKTRLVLTADDIEVYPDETLYKPFKKGSRVTAKIMCHARLPHQYIAVASNRNITLFAKDVRVGQTLNLKITRSKHNVYQATKN
ncbi:radical SAM protein [Candidatus Woesearchaeota archaeon]|nr:radical SAM protein [Candidatus Woesearchaeota archaeon]